MMTIHYIIASIIAIIFGQISSHLNKKLPPVVAEEITYKEFFESLKKDFRIDIFYTFIFLVLFNSFIHFLGINLTTYLYMIVSLALSLAFSVDVRFRLIPDETHIIILFAGLINFMFNLSNWWNYLLGAIIGGAIFWGLGLLSIIIFKKEGMGFGDVKLMASLGFMFGIKNILVITLVSFVFGAIIGGAILILKRNDNDGYIPFGPFIVIGAIIIMFVPSDIIINIYIEFCTWLGLMMSDAAYFLINKFS